jgi:CheY-like chemotaxis protein
VLDGIEATRRLREQLPSAAVVMLTSSDDPSDRARARAAGAVDYLTKDADLGELEAALTGAVEARPADAAHLRPMVVLPA